MSFAIELPRGHRATDEFVRRLLAKVARFVLLTVGGLVLLGGLILAPLPGHLGLPLLVVGLMIVLRNAYWAKRAFIRLQRAHPKVMFPIRRLMRRKPEIVLVIWQQYLRLERLVLPPKTRFAVKARHRLKRVGRGGFAPFGRRTTDVI